MTRVADHFRFLTEKKVAQLVKLINHLSGELEDRKYQMELAELELNSSLSDIKQKMEAEIRQSSERLSNNESDAAKKILAQQEERVKHLQNDLDSRRAARRADLAELEATVQRETSQMKLSISEILERIASESAKVDAIAETVREQCGARVVTLNAEHQKQVQAMDADSQRQLEELQIQTDRKLDELERDFARSIAALKSDFGTAPVVSESTHERTRELGMALAQTKAAAEVSRRDLEGIVDSVRATILDSQRRARDACEDMIAQERQHAEQMAPLVQDLERQECAWKDEEQALNAEFERLSLDRMARISAVQRELDRLRLELEAEGREMRGGLKQSVRQQSDDVEKVRQDLSAETHAKEIDYRIEREAIENSIEELSKALDAQRTPLAEEEKRLRDAVEALRSEREALAAELASVAERSRQEFAASYERERHRLDEESGPTRREIEESTAVRDALLRERDELRGRCGIDLEKDEDVRRLSDELERSLGALKADHERRLQSIINDENVILEAARRDRLQIQSEHRERLERDRIAALQGLEAPASDFEAEINAEYEAKLRDLTEALESMPEAESPAEVVVEPENEEVAKRRAEIEKERRDLIDAFVSQQKLEENRHLRHVSSLDVAPKNADADLNRLRQEHQVEFEKLKIIESELQTELANEAAKASKREAELQRVIDALDTEQKQIEVQLAEAKKSADESLVSSEESFTEAKKSVVDKIEEIEERLSKVEAASKTHTLKSQQGVQDAYNDSEETLRTLEERHRMSVEKEGKLHYCEVEVRTLKHQEAVKSLAESIDALRTTNASDIRKFQAEFNAAQSTRDEEIARREGAISDDLQVFRKEGDDSIALLQELLDRKTHTLKELQEKVEGVGTRVEDMARIEQLENALKLKTTHLTELTKDLVLCKKQMVAQEGVYNSRFGAPNVAVLRPQTAGSTAGGLPGGRSRGGIPRPMQRPFTSASVRPILLTHGRGTRL